MLHYFDTREWFCLYRGMKFKNVKIKCVQVIKFLYIGFSDFQQKLDSWGGWGKQCMWFWAKMPIPSVGGGTTLTDKKGIQPRKKRMVVTLKELGELIFMVGIKRIHQGWQHQKVVCLMMIDDDDVNQLIFSNFWLFWLLYLMFCTSDLGVCMCAYLI